MSQSALQTSLLYGLDQVGPGKNRYTLWTPTSFAQVRYKYDEIGINWWFEAGAPSCGRVGPINRGKSTMKTWIASFCNACSESDAAALVAGQKTLGVAPSSWFGGPNDPLYKTPAYKAKYGSFRSATPAAASATQIAAVNNVAATANAMAN